MTIGFELEETLSGSWYRLDDDRTDRAIRYTLKIAAHGLRRFVKDRRLEAVGTIFLEGLAEGEGGAGVPVFGAVTFRLFDQRRVPYDLELRGDDGRHYRLRGQRDFFMHDALDSLTVFPASLYDEAGMELGRATLRFDPRAELGPTLRSVRPRFGRAGSHGRKP